MEDEESLEPGALVSQLPDAVKHKVDNFLSFKNTNKNFQIICLDLSTKRPLTDGVVASGIVVSCIFLSSDELFRMEQLAVSA